MGGVSIPPFLKPPSGSYELEFIPFTGKQFSNDYSDFFLSVRFYPFVVAINATECRRNEFS